MKRQYDKKSKTCAAAKKEACPENHGDDETFFIFMEPGSDKEPGLVKEYRQARRSADQKGQLDIADEGLGRWVQTSLETRGLARRSGLIKRRQLTGLQRLHFQTAIFEDFDTTTNTFRWCGGRSRTDTELPPLDFESRKDSS